MADGRIAADPTWPPARSVQQPEIVTFPSEYQANEQSPRNRTTDAPVAMDMAEMSQTVPPSLLGELTARLNIPRSWVGMSGYLVAGIFLGLILIGALSIGRSSNDANAIPPPSANAILDNVVRLHARDIGTTCWTGLESKQGPARLTVALEVGVDGKIRYAAASGESPAMRECVETHVKSWEFLPQAQAQTMALPFEVDRR
jgi:hypothetical protein